MTDKGYVVVPLGQLSRWERLVERVTGWTRMGPQEWVFCDDRWWSRDVNRRPAQTRKERSDV